MNPNLSVILVSGIVYIGLDKSSPKTAFIKTSKCGILFINTLCNSGNVIADIIRTAI